MKMRRIILILSLSLLPGLGSANIGGVHLQHVELDLHDQASLQRGTRTFMNYCFGCHSLQYIRYNRLARDIGLTDSQMKDNLMFNTDNIRSVIQSSFKPAEGHAWYATPDLSVIARARGADYLYSYLLGFYLDPSRPTGVNNTVFKDAAMPDVLWELQGFQRLVKSDEEGGAGKLELVRAGKQTEAEYRETVRDLVNFLEYVGEPAKLVRYRIGGWVMLFLIVFATLAWKLKKEYWKDLH